MMKTWLKGRAAEALMRLGWDVHHKMSVSTPSGSLSRLLRHHRVDLVLDVGANEGQYGRYLRDIGFTETIVSFEPLAAAHRKLLRVAARDARWVVAPRMALGDSSGEASMHVSEMSAASSLLAPLPSLVATSPSTRTVASERVPVRRLDAVANEYIRDASRPFLKLDVQGFEHKVIDGASGIIDRLVGLQCEMSFTPLYAEQQLWQPTIERLHRAGFSLHALLPVFSDAQTGQLYQADGVFFRP